MASVTINSGDLEGPELARDVPVSKWPELLKKRNWFCRIGLTADCRHVAQYVQEAEIMFEKLGFSSPDDMIRNGYELNPKEIRIVAKWLELNDPGEAVPLNEALERSGALEVRAKEVLALKDHGGDGSNQYSKVDKSKNVNLAKTQGGNQADYRIAKLKRDHPEIVERMAQGEFKNVAQAERAAGTRPPLPSPLEKYQKQVERLAGNAEIDLDERIRLFRIMLADLEKTKAMQGAE